jgi:hypothetical protein
MELLDTVGHMRRTIQTHEARLAALEERVNQRALRHQQWSQRSPARNDRGIGDG